MIQKALPVLLIQQRAEFVHYLDTIKVEAVFCCLKGKPLARNQNDVFWTLICLNGL